MRSKTLWMRILALALAVLTVSAGMQTLLPGVTITAQAADGYLWPVPSSTNVSLGHSSEHPGICITGSKGCDVVATKAGTVFYVYTGCRNSSARAVGGRSCGSSTCSPSSGNFYQYTRSNGTTFKACNWGYGNGVVIRHADGSGFSMYALMSTVSVSKGATVAQGQKIGTMGDSGNATGTNLHFRLSSGGRMDGTYFRPSDDINNNVSTGIYNVSTSPITFDSVYNTSVTSTSAIIKTDVTADVSRLTEIGAYVNGQKAAWFNTGDVLHFCSVQLGGSNPEAYPNGLTPSTTYSYYFYAIDTNGKAYYSETKTFTTLAASAPITWDKVYAKEITETSAQIWAEVTSDCTQLKEVGAYVNGAWAASWPTNLKLTYCSVQLGGEKPEAYASGLRPGTTYTYYFYVLTKSGTMITRPVQMRERKHIPAQNAAR